MVTTKDIQLKIIKLLNENVRLTMKDIRVSLNIPRRTTYSNLKVLIENGIIQYRSSLKDTRQKYYYLVL